MAEDTPFDDEVTTATTDEAPEVKATPEATASEVRDVIADSSEVMSGLADAETTGNMQGEGPEDMTSEVGGPSPEPEVMDNGQFQAQLLERDKDIGRATEVLEELKKSRNKFYAEWQPKVNASLSLHELNQIQQRITRTEGARRNRVIEGMDRLASTMNLRPRPTRDPMFPHESPQED